jgi:hypothetical protein
VKQDLLRRSDADRSTDLGSRDGGVDAYGATTGDVASVMITLADGRTRTVVAAVVRSSGAREAMSPRTESRQPEVELGADLEELRQLRRELERLAVGHQLGAAFEDGDATCVVEVRAERHAGVPAREQ